MSASTLIVQKVEDDHGFNLLFNIRTTVFVEEISLEDEDDFDGFDHLAIHYLATLDEQPVGTGRARIQPVSGKVKFERIAVLSAFRGKGYGATIVHKMMSDVPKGKHIYIHSLIETIGFFEKIGFQQEGDQFEEAGKAHMRMTVRGGQD